MLSTQATRFCYNWFTGSTGLELPAYTEFRRTSSIQIPGSKEDMASDPQQVPPLFTHVDVTAGTPAKKESENQLDLEQVVGLLREVVANQDRQNQLMEELVSQMSASQRQRAAELGQWKQANPGLARNCRLAAESLSKAQTEYLRNLTEEITDNEEGLADSDYLLNELIDRFGPRLAHLNGVLQVLSQLSPTPKSAHNVD